MKIYIDRTHCDICEAYCDRHVSKLIRFPLGEDRPCLQAVEDDGLPELRLVVKDGERETTLVLSGQDREVAAFEGLSTLLP